MSCCPSESLPALQTEYSPKGKEINLDGLLCYTVGSGKKAVIVYYDIFGYDGGRTKAICDQIADGGYYVVLPDIYHGDAWPADKPFDTLMDWVKGFPWDPMIKNDTEKLLSHLDSCGVNSIGTLGFCAGAFSVFHLCQHGGKVKCGASMHPSVQLCGQFGENPEQLAELLQCPQLLYPAGGDPDFYKSSGKVYKILMQKFGDKNDIKEFPEMNHGWVPRGDLNNPDIKRDVKLAMEGLMTFLSSHM